VEAAPEPGGLARTERTSEGFLFDMGGHVIFSHWDYFDRAVDAGLEAEARAAEAQEAAAAAAGAAASDLVAHVRLSGAVAVKQAAKQAAALHEEEEEDDEERWQIAAPAPSAGRGGGCCPEGGAATNAANTASTSPPPPPHHSSSSASSSSLWNVLQRVSYVWIRGRWVAYPFQNNLAALPLEDQAVCLEGLAEAQAGRRWEAAAAAAAPPLPAPITMTFDDWILRNLGKGIADLFMRPYNAKVWACSPERMSCSWLGERVAAADFGRALRNALRGRVEEKDAGWGPNAVFRFPRSGGTGAIWRGLARRLPMNKQRYGDAVVSINPGRREAAFASGRRVRYGAVVSTLPLDRMAAMCGRADLAEGLEYSSTHVIGVGVRLKGGRGKRGGGVSGREEAVAAAEATTAEPPAATPATPTTSSSSSCCPLGNKCWMYFPEDDCPFYRATVFSNYADGNCPAEDAELPTLCLADGSSAEGEGREGGEGSKGGPYWSLMFEVSESRDKPVDCRPTFLGGRPTARPGGDSSASQEDPTTSTTTTTPTCCWPRVVLDTLRGAVATGLLSPEDQIVSLMHTRLERGYPTPTLGRDAALERALPWLRDEARVWSRGRFGAWRYELGNQDHALMQGVEAADAALAVVSAEEERGQHGPSTVGADDLAPATISSAVDADVDPSEPTLRDADAANATKHATPVWDEYC
jgi:protoporphyrinogen oxidase